jgi:DNA-binding SARP family transcriptional activator
VLRYEVLGPLRVSDDLYEISVSAAKQRVILALLLISPNRVVTTERLIYELWGDSPPATASGTLQSLISRLKRMLNSNTANGDVPLIRRSAGYELLVADGCLDLLILDSTVETVRERITEGRLREAAPYIDSALRLWRGPTLAGVPITPQLSAETTRLEELRLALHEDQADLRLAVGEYEKVVSQHRSLLLEHPLRERLWAQLMLALYRSGRQGDALKTFRDARECLAGELGIEPGPDLQQLHHEILQGCVPAQKQLSSVVVSPLPKPHQLPPVTSDFTGREQESATISAVLARAGKQQAVTVVAISGMAGVGKTTCSLRVAHRMVDEFPDGQLYVDLRGAEPDPLGPGEVLSRFLRAIGTAGTDLPSSVDERLAMYRSSLAGRRMLVILDNAADEAQVASLFPGSPTCAVIVTSRRRLSGLAGAHHVELDMLSENEAISLLEAIAGPNRVVEDRQSACRLARLCGYHPLSLRICGTRLAARPHWSIGTFAQRLADRHVRLNELGYGTMNVRASFNLSYEGLGPQTRRLFCLLGLLDSPDFAAWLAAPLLDTSVERAEEQIELLVESRMLEIAQRDQTGRARYRFHDLIHCFSRELAATMVSSEERRAILDRVLGAWLALADRAHESSYGANFLLSHGDAPRWPLEEHYSRSLLAEPWLWWESERGSLVAVIRQAADEGLDEACWDLAVTSTTLFGTYRYLEDWWATHEAALTVTRRLGNRRGEAISMSHTGGLRIFQRRYEDAVDLLRSAADLLSELGERRAQAFAYVGLGIAERGRADLQKALQYFLVSRNLLDANHDLLAEAHVLLHMGQTYLSLRDIPQAEDLLVQSRTIAQRIESRPIEGYISRWLGETYLAKGDCDRAEMAFLRSVELISPIGDTQAEALALQGLARTMLSRGDRARAGSFLTRTAAATLRMPDSSRAARILGELGSLFFAQGSSHRATECLLRSVEIFRSVGADQLEAGSLRRLAKVQLSMGEPNLAANSLERAGKLLAGPTET